ncbi:hypothetical protein OF83DRAFT_1112220 [Amylostereum chailletii]|nr:hypothetical protein OF83DRAFT_1112220 [Amylostereum chailletii]
MQDIASKLQGLFAGEGKPRLYMGYYDRRRGTANFVGEPYHTGLIVAPKGASLRTSTSGEVAMRLHATNSLWRNPTSGQVSMDWRYESKPTTIRTNALVGMIYLGKVVHHIITSLEEFLVQVPVVNNSPEWMCQHWVFDALQLLRDKTIICPFAGTPQDLWQIGKDSLLARGVGRDIVVLDVNGREIPGSLA